MLHPQPEDNRIRWLMAFNRADAREACCFGLRGRGEAYPSGGLRLPAKEIELPRSVLVRLALTPFPMAAALVRHVYALGDAALQSFWNLTRDAAPETALPVFDSADWA